MKKCVLLILSLLCSLVSPVSGQRYYDTFFDFSVERPQHVVFDNKDGALYHLTWVLKSLDLYTSSARSSAHYKFNVYIDIEKDGKVENFAHLVPHPRDKGFYILETRNSATAAVDSTIENSISLVVKFNATSRCDDSVLYRIGTSAKRESVWKKVPRDKLMCVDCSYEWERQDGLIVIMWHMGARFDCTFDRSEANHMCNAWMIYIGPDDYFNEDFSPGWMTLKDGTQYWYGAGNTSEANVAFTQSTLETFSPEMKLLVGSKKLMQTPGKGEHYKKYFRVH